jgi:heme exporter protein C
MNVKKHWWKILGVAIVGYTLVAGLIVPLKPGIISVSHKSANAGDSLRIEVIGYNTHFEGGKEDLKLWLKGDTTFFIQGQDVMIADENTLEVTFVIPALLPFDRSVVELSLLIYNGIDGPFILPSAIFITHSPGSAGVQIGGWMKNIDLEIGSSRMAFPFRNILKETIRNTYFHVPLWFTMIFILIGSVFNALKYLRTGAIIYDEKSSAYATVGLLFGILGLLTGAVWAKNTWGAYWSFDIKQNMTAIALLIYFAYFVLRGSLEESTQKGKVSAVYNIFAFATLIPLLYIIPRLTDSLHPGAGGNPAFGGEDLDNTMRMVFYPAIIGWTLLAYWMGNLLHRAQTLKNKILFQ